MSAYQVRVPHRVLAFIGLVLLATLSLVLGTKLHWYWGDVVVSLTIAGIKAYLVLFFFMDLASQPFRSRMAILVGVALVLLLVGFVAMEVATRRVTPMGLAPQPTESFYRR
jgi:caa(3)-type oxidase subunit IV